MSGADAGWLALSGLCCDRRLRLASALAASLLGHVLLLFAPLPLSTGVELGGARTALSTLRVSLNLFAETDASPVRGDDADAKAAGAPALGSAPDQPRGAPPSEQGTQDGIALVGYYPAARLSRMPEGIGIFDIQPPAGGDTGIGGKMTIRVWISAKGGIDSLRVLASELPAAYAEAALTAFKRMRFAPGEIFGAPVPSRVDIVIEYADFRREAAQSPAGNK